MNKVIFRVPAPCSVSPLRLDRIVQATVIKCGHKIPQGGSSFTQNKSEKKSINSHSTFAWWPCVIASGAATTSRETRPHPNDPQIHQSINPASDLVHTPETKTSQKPQQIHTFHSKNNSRCACQNLGKQNVSLIPAVAAPRERALTEPCHSTIQQSINPLIQCLVSFTLSKPTQIKCVYQRPTRS